MNHSTYILVPSDRLRLLADKMDDGPLYEVEFNGELHFVSKYRMLQWADKFERNTPESKLFVMKIANIIYRQIKNNS